MWGIYFNLGIMQKLLKKAHMYKSRRYIHLNPVRANMVEKPKDYCWSSYLMYIGKEKEKLINSESILSYFKGSRDLYKQYVENATIL